MTEPQFIPPAPGNSPARTTLFKGAKFDFDELSWTAPDGRMLKRQFVRHPGSVVILPVLEAPGQPPSIVLIRNFRHAVSRVLWELPAGTRDQDEDPSRCAARELMEETGYQAATLRPLCRFHTSPGLSDEWMHAFVARGLTHVGQRLEPDEDLTVHPLPIDDGLALIDSGELVDCKSMAVLLYARRRGVI